MSPTIQCPAIAPDRMLLTLAAHDRHQRGVREKTDEGQFVSREGVRFRAGDAADVAHVVVEWSSSCARPAHT
jgi:hypothetical protein